MDNDENYDEILSFLKNHKIRENSPKRVITEEDLIKMLMVKTNLSEEEIRDFYKAYNCAVKELYKKNPEGVKNYFKERYGGDFTIYDI